MLALALPRKAERALSACFACSALRNTRSLRSTRVTLLKSLVKKGVLDVGLSKVEESGISKGEVKFADIRRNAKSEGSSLDLY